MVDRAPLSWWWPAVDRPDRWRWWLTWSWGQLDVWVPYWIVGVRAGAHLVRHRVEYGGWWWGFQAEVVVGPVVGVWLVVDRQEPENDNRNVNAEVPGT